MTRALSTLLLPLLLLSFVRLAAAAGAIGPVLDEAEQREWVDPESALELLSVTEPRIRSDEDRVQWLVLRGLALVDTRQDDKVDAIVQQLAATAPPTAKFASQFLRAFSLAQKDEFAEANQALQTLPTGVPISDTERYRVEMLRARVKWFLGQQEPALQAYEHALAVANRMSSPPRVIRALTRRSQLFSSVNDFERATSQILAARTLAESRNDIAALVNIARQQADIADRRGDRAAERAASLESIEYARRANSPALLAPALANLADSYMKARQFKESLRYSQEALDIAKVLRREGLEQTIRFNMGIAQIGLGRADQGMRLAEDAIARTLQSGNILDADVQLREYGAALEASGYWRAALDVNHRSNTLRDQLMSTTRQRALLELSAKFDDENRARELELLKRDNAIKDVALGAQRLRLQMILLAAALATGVCVALIWSSRRVRRANEHLRYQSAHDSLTGLRNRRYFYEHIAAHGPVEPFVGSMLLIDLDHFKKINDTYGHPAGDAVLVAIGKRLAAALREEDLLVRWGGEEFLGLLLPMTDEQIDATARRLLHSVRSEPVSWNNLKITCTISIGYATFPLSQLTTSVSIDRAISLVDKALYQAKQLGRDRACMIRAIRASSEAELASIGAQFEAATEDDRVQLVETLGLQQA